MIRAISGSAMRYPVLLFLLIVSTFFLACPERPDARARRQERKQESEFTDERGLTEGVPDRADTVRMTSLRVGDSIDGRVRKVSSRVKRGLSLDPARYLGELVEELLRGVTDDSTRTKILHDWVADNIRYDTEAYLSGSIGSQGYAEVLRTGRAVCAGVAGLFNELCATAGLECVTISGYARGFSFKVFEPEDPTEQNHAWNAVFLNGRWRLIDATWNAGHIDQGKYKQRYSTQYLFAAPEDMIHTHFPADPQWQLLEEPLSAEAFLKLPYLRGEFFRLGLRLLTPTDIVNEVGPQTSLEVSVLPKVTLIATLLRPDGSKAGDRIVSEQQDDVVRFDIAFPGPGRWLLRLYAAYDDPYGSHRWVADCGYVSAQALP